MIHDLFDLDDACESFGALDLPPSDNFEKIFVYMWSFVAIVAIGYVAPTVALLLIIYIASVDFSIMTATNKRVYEPTYSNLDDEEESVHSDHDLYNNSKNDCSDNNNTHHNHYEDDETNLQHRSKMDHNDGLDDVHSHRINLHDLVEISRKLCE